MLKICSFSSKLEPDLQIGSSQNVPVPAPQHCSPPPSLLPTYQVQLNWNMFLCRVNKKTRKREKYLENIKKAHKKKKKKDRAPQFNFSALHLIHDPQVKGKQFNFPILICIQKPFIFFVHTGTIISVFWIGAGAWSVRFRFFLPDLEFLAWSGYGPYIF